jgi:hypothetical protein
LKAITERKSVGILPETIEATNSKKKNASKLDRK